VNVEVSFQLTLADVLAARRFLLLRSKAGWLLPLLAVVLVADAIVRSSWSNALYSVLWLGMLGPWLLYLQPRRAFKATPSMRAAHSWVVGPDGLRFEAVDADSARLASSEMAWATIARARESRAAFVLQPSRGTACVLPKRAFTPQALAEMRTLLAAHVPKVAQRLAFRRAA